MRMWFIRNQQTDGWICSLFISNSWIRSSPVGTVLVTELAPWSHPLEVPMKPPHLLNACTVSCQPLLLWCDSAAHGRCRSWHVECIRLEKDGALPVEILQSLRAVPWGAEDESFNSVKLCVGCVWPTGYVHHPSCSLECRTFQPSADYVWFLNCLTKQNL